MEIIKRNMPGILPDNEMFYFSFIFKVVEKVDSDAQISIIKTLQGYSFNIRASKRDLRDTLIAEVTEANKILMVEVEFCKSLEYSSLISYMIKIGE